MMGKTKGNGPGVLRQTSLILAISGAFLLCPGGAVAANPAQGEETAVLAGRHEADRLAAEALSLMADNKLDEASEKINQALKLQIPRSYYHLVNGLIYHLQAQRGGKGNRDLAAQGYELAIQFDPGNWLAYYFSGLLALEQQQYSKGRNLLAEAVRYRKDDRALLNAFAYASYRAGSPDIAAAAVNALEHSGGLRSSTELSNAALVMAAVGEKDKAQAYLARLGDNKADRKQYLSRRVSDWNDYYHQSGLQKVAEGWGSAPAAADTPADGAAPGWGESAAAKEAPGWGNQEAESKPAEGRAGLGGRVSTAQGTEEKMVVVDLVMIGTEETVATRAGVNLLQGLSLQFGSTAAPALSRVSTVGVDSIAMIRTLTIPAIAYTLNIVNANSQRSEILTRPTLVATAGKSSEFFAGTELNAAAVAAAGSGAVASQPVSIQKEIGVKMALVPAFLEDGRLKLQITAQRTFIKTPNQNVDFQMKLETTKLSINASVVMRYGETLILGGLNEKETERIRDGVPLLQDIPLVQYLFSSSRKTDYQNSLLILITPRLPQYVYQPEKAREEYEKSLSEEERPLASLRTRYADWFKPYPNWASVFNRLQGNSLYREFRTGDVTLETWSSGASLKERLGEIQDFLYY